MLHEGLFSWKGQTPPPQQGTRNMRDGSPLSVSARSSVSDGALVTAWHEQACVVHANGGRVVCVTRWSTRRCTDTIASASSELGSGGAPRILRRKAHPASQSTCVPAVPLLAVKELVEGLPGPRRLSRHAVLEVRRKHLVARLLSRALARCVHVQRTEIRVSVRLENGSELRHHEGDGFGGSPTVHAENAALEQLPVSLRALLTSSLESSLRRRLLLLVQLRHVLGVHLSCALSRLVALVVLSLPTSILGWILDWPRPARKIRQVGCRIC